MPKREQSNSNQTEPYSAGELLELLHKGIETIDAAKLSITPPHTIASFLNRLNVEDCRAILRKVPDIDASAILTEMDVGASAEIVAAMREWRALRILEEFDPDDAADLLSELDEDDRVRLLEKLGPEQAKKVRALLKYAPDTAGGVMTPNFVAVNENMTVEEAIQVLRRLRNKVHEVSYIYAIDAQGKLKGILSLRDLILADAKDQVLDIMNTKVQGICEASEDREKVARKMSEFNLYDLPVVDDEGRLLGIVEHDDVIDIIQDEATEDFQKLVGAGADETIHDKLASSIRKRSPWLLVNLLTAVMGATVISLFQEEIKQLTLLAVFMPAIASLAGNTGAQTLAVSIRSMTMGDIESFDSLRICIKEASKGILNGILIGLIASLAVWVWTKELKVASVVFLAMILNMGLGGMAGAFIPLMLKKIGCDPAQSSSIFLTGLTDVCGFLIFLGLGTWLLF